MPAGASGGKKMKKGFSLVERLSFALPGKSVCKITIVDMQSE